MKRLVVLLMLFSMALMGAVPAIMVKKDSAKPSEPLGIKDLKINVDVAGNLATTTMEITFFNDLDRILEGQFYFPLVEGAVVSRFALDINGKLREGVVVEKSKGQKVYESVIRQKIDPGLLQWTKGNNFKARIYPIPAKGTKKLLIAYEQELTKTAEGYLYKLPLSFKDKMDLFSVNVTAHNQKVQPVVAAKKELINFSFKEKNGNFHATFVQEQSAPDKTLSFLMPQKSSSSVLVKKGKRENHFYVHVAPKVSKREKKLPRNLCIVWDGSNSAKTKDVKREMALINDYIKKLNNPMIFLWVLRNDLERIGRISPKKLNETINNMAYDGGTQLGALNMRLKQFSICEEMIFSTDGISNFGKSTPIFEEIPIMVLNSKITAEHSVLNYIARRSGGIYINLAKLSQKAAEMLLTKQPFQFIKATYSKNITESYPSLPTPVVDQFGLSGKMKGDSGEITLHFGFGTKVITREKIKLDLKKQRTESEMIPRVWAKMKIAELDQQPKKYEQELVKLGKKHSIVTRYTSLLVLDRLEDYVQHNIVPPKELQEQYFKIVENKKAQQKKSELEKLDNLYNRYQNMITYWNKKFKWNKPKPKPMPKKMAVRRSARPRPAPRTQALALEDSAVGGVDMAKSAEAPLEKMEEAKEDAPMLKKPAGGEGEGATGGIKLAKWDPQTPYIKKLKAVKKGHYKLYLTLKKGNENSSAFYLDVADFFMNNKQRKLALRVLSNIAEMELENHQLLRILGHRLAQLKYYDLAISIFKQVAQMRKEEPQSFRDLGLTYALNHQPQKAIDHLYKVAIGTWDSRFSDIDLIALHEMNGIIALNKGKVNTSKLQKRLIKNLHTDIRVVLNWDTDNSDMDLWVTDPNGEKCYYGHKKTFIGGWMSRDFTGGYGPEAFWLKRAKPGEYKIEVNYYGSSQQVIAGATTLQIQLFLNYGRKNQKLKEITLRLTDRGSKVVQAGTFTIK